MIGAVRTVLSNIVQFVRKVRGKILRKASKSFQTGTEGRSGANDVARIVGRVDQQFQTESEACPYALAEYGILAYHAPSTCHVHLARG